MISPKKNPEILFQSKWPLPQYDDTKVEPHFIFIVAPPYSGSTALAKILNSSWRTMLLQNKGEGQWLIPGLCEHDRWNPNKEVNYKSVKAVWLQKYQNEKKTNSKIDVVIEKSPPNMMRIEKLSAQFKYFSMIANNRNPYANCASILYRNHDAEKIGYEERSNLLKQLVKGWVLRSIRIKEIVNELQIPLITYEVFCRNPHSLLGVLQKPNGIAESINPNCEVKIKDYKVQGILNMNDRQISNLKDREIDVVSKILSRNKDLMDFFNYTII